MLPFTSHIYITQIHLLPRIAHKFTDPHSPFSSSSNISFPILYFAPILLLLQPSHHTPFSMKRQPPNSHPSLSLPSSSFGFDFSFLIHDPNSTIATHSNAILSLLDPRQGFVSQILLLKILPLAQLSLPPPHTFIYHNHSKVWRQQCFHGRISNRSQLQP